jgi:hypothetical protein
MDRLELSAPIVGIHVHRLWEPPAAAHHRGIATEKPAVFTSNVRHQAISLSSHLDSTPWQNLLPNVSIQLGILGVPDVHLA